MLIWIFKKFFGDFIGLKRIPKSSRDKVAKAAMELAKEGVRSAAASGGKEMMVEFRRKF